MRAVVSRVEQASVTVNQQIVGEINQGLLVMLGVARQDTEKDVAYLVDKISKLRIFSDPAGKMNLSVTDKKYSVLVVSQFTLSGDVRKGSRPSFSESAPAVQAKDLYLNVAKGLSEKGLLVATGEFQASMKVASVGDGPVTILLDSEKKF